MRERRKDFDQLPILRELRDDFEKACGGPQDSVAGRPRFRVRPARTVTVLVASLALSATAYATVARPWEQRPVAPDRSLPLLGENRHGSLSDYKGKIVIATFWASWCPPCKAQTEALAHLGSELRVSNDTVTVLIDWRDNPTAARTWLKDNALTMPVLSDTNEKLADQYDINAIPATFIIDKDGRLTTKHLGLMSERQIKRAVRQARQPLDTPSQPIPPNRP